MSQLQLQDMGNVYICCVCGPDGLGWVLEPALWSQVLEFGLCNNLGITKGIMTYRIRPGQQSDVVACVEILCAWEAETPWLLDPRTPGERVLNWRGFFRHDLAWVAQSEERLVGFCSRGGDNINGLYVAADWRNRGVGKGLLDTAKVGRDWITVWAYEKNVQARTFYRREGLIEVGREIEDGSGLVDIEHRWTRHR